MPASMNPDFCLFTIYTQGRKVEGGSKNPKGPLGTCFQKFFKNPRVPLWLSFLFALGGQKNQGSPLGSFFDQLKGVSQKIDFFPKIFGSGKVKPPWTPRAHIW